MLTGDSFTTKTFDADTTMILGNVASMTAAGIAADPAFGYVKELDQLCTSGGVTAVQ